MNEACAGCDNRMKKLVDECYRDCPVLDMIERGVMEDLGTPGWMRSCGNVFVGLRILNFSNDGSLWIYFVDDVGFCCGEFNWEASESMEVHY